MRGKRTEDLIFNGGESSARGNRASVKLVFDNSKRLLNIDFDEVSLERVIHRDSLSDYFINGSPVRLRDIVELVRNRETREPLAPFNGTSPEMQRLAAFLRQEGMYAFVNWNNLFTNPPLCITEEQLREAFAVIDRALEITDAVVMG